MNVTHSYTDYLIPVEDISDFINISVSSGAESLIKKDFYINSNNIPDADRDYKVSIKVEVTSL
jgi:hypothetical protein